MQINIALKNKCALVISFMVSMATNYVTSKNGQNIELRVKLLYVSRIFHYQSSGKYGIGPRSNHNGQYT